MKKIFFLFIALCCLVLYSCGDKANFEQNVIPADGARLKFYHLAPDAPGVNIFANDVKISGVNTVSPFPPATQTTPNLLTYGGTFPVQDYAALAAGSIKLRVTVPATATTSELTAVATEVPFDNGKFYSIYAYGTSPTYNALVLTDDFTVTDPKKAYVRFVNLVNPTATATSPSYDFTVNGTTITAGVGFAAKNAGYTAIDPIAYGATKVSVTAKTGTTTVAGGSSFSLQPYAGRFYTVILSGIIGGTGAKAPTLYASVNK